MSHPAPGHDYTEQGSDESNKEYKARSAKGKVLKRKIHIKNRRPKKGGPYAAGLMPN